MQTQETTAKKPRTEESRPKKAKPANSKTPILLHNKSTESGKTSCIDKKKEYLKKKQDQKNSVLAIGDNAIDPGEKKRNN